MLGARFAELDAWEGFSHDDPWRVRGSHLLAAASPGTSWSPSPSRRRPRSACPAKVQSPALWPSPPAPSLSLAPFPVSLVWRRGERVASADLRLAPRAPAGAP